MFLHRAASVPLAYVPAIHVFLAATPLRRGCPGHLARRRASRFCPGMTSFTIENDYSAASRIGAAALWKSGVTTAFFER